jgi:hypothetical protein
MIFVDFHADLTASMAFHDTPGFEATRNPATTPGPHGLERGDPCDAIGARQWCTLPTPDPAADSSGVSPALSMDSREGSMP